jgi:hypothetical protein
LTSVTIQVHPIQDLLSVRLKKPNPLYNPAKKANQLLVLHHQIPHQVGVMNGGQAVQVVHHPVVQAGSAVQQAVTICLTTVRFWELFPKSHFLIFLEVDFSLFYSF